MPIFLCDQRKMFACSVICIIEGIFACSRMSLSFYLLYFDYDIYLKFIRLVWNIFSVLLLILNRMLLRMVLPID